MWFDGKVNGKHVKDSARAVTAGSYMEAKAYSNTGASRGLYVLKVEKPSRDSSSGLLMKGAVVGSHDGYYDWYWMARGKSGARAKDSGFHLCACNRRHCRETKIGASRVEHIDS